MADIDFSIPVRQRAIQSRDPITSTVVTSLTEQAFCIKANNEKLARETFTSNQMTCHNSLRLKEVGLVVNPKFPHLGASPDGIVQCKCCPPTTLEIKCPFKYVNMSIPDAIKSKDFCLGKNVELKKDHAYYAQVQGQMEVCELKTSYFVIWTTQEYHTQKVEFSEEYWAQVRPKLDLFYRQLILTEICTIDRSNRRNYF